MTITNKGCVRDHQCPHVSSTDQVFNKKMAMLRAAVGVFLMSTCLYIIKVDSGAVKCSHNLENYYLQFTPFFHTKPLVSTTLPCRYKLAHFQCGDTRVEAIGDVQLSAVYSFNRQQILGGVTLGIRTNSGQSGVYSITSNTLKQYLDAGDFTKDPWKKDNPVDVNSFFLKSSSAAVIQKGGLTIQYLWRRELASDWKLGKISSGPLFTISCTDAFNTYEGFPNTTCGHLNYNKKLLLSTEDILTDFHMDLHHVASLNRHYGNHAMLSYHNVQQTNAMCQEASTIARGTCEGNSKYWGRGDIFFNCGELYKSNLGCAQDKGIDPMKWYVACLRALCPAEGEAISAETCETLSQMVRECGPVQGAPRRNRDFLISTRCPVDSSIPEIPTTTASSRWWTPICRLIDRSNISYSFTKQLYLTPMAIQIFASPWTSDPLDVPCRYKLADFQCSGAKVVVEVDFEPDVDGFTVPNDVRVVITTSDGKVTIDINHRDVQQLKEQTDLAHVESWVTDVLANAGSSVQPNGIQLSYDQTSRTVTLLRQNLNITYSYIDYTNASRANFIDVLSVGCDASDFSSTNVPDTLCGDGTEGYYFAAPVLDPLNLDPAHTYEFGKDAVFLAKQDVQQKKETCIDAKSVLSLGLEGCTDFGEAVFECQFLTSIKHYYGSCMVANKLDRLQVLTSCLHVQCETAEARTPKTCSILKAVLHACGASPAANNKDLYSNNGVHMHMATLLAKAGCVWS